MTRPKIILFDIDGTLLLTGGAGKTAFETVFQEHFQISGAWQDIHPDGRTDPSLIDELFRKNLSRLPTEGEREAVAAAYAAAMEKALQSAPRFRLMPGVSQCLADLKAEGFLLGLATGNFEATAYQKLRRASLHEYFSFGGFGSDHADRFELTRVAMERGMAKWGRAIEARDFLLIGDTVHDVECGKRCGMMTAAVATGRTTSQELAAQRPDYLFPDLSDRERLRAAFHPERP